MIRQPCARRVKFIEKEDSLYTSSSSEESLDLPLEIREGNRKKTIATFLKSSDRDVVKGPKFKNEVSKEASMAQIQALGSANIKQLHKYASERNFISNELWSEKHYKAIMKFSNIDKLTEEIKSLRWRKNANNEKEDQKENYKMQPGYLFIKNLKKSNRTNSQNIKSSIIMEKKKSKILNNSLRKNFSLPSINPRKALANLKSIPQLEKKEMSHIKKSCRTLISDCSDYLKDVGCLNREISLSFSERTVKRDRIQQKEKKIAKIQTEWLESLSGSKIHTKNSTYLDTETEVSEGRNKFISFNKKMFQK